MRVDGCWRPDSRSLAESLVQVIFVRLLNVQVVQTLAALACLAEDRRVKDGIPL